MPIVTPNWNLPTPALTDAYNLVGDLATFSSAVDGAITSVANAFKGTSAQRIAAAATSVDGVLWQDTDGIKMIWKRDGSVAGQWAPAVARWIGTTAQMNAFTQAPNGFEWFNTSDSKQYIRLAGAWASGASSTAITLTSGVAASGYAGPSVTVSGGIATLVGRINNGNGLILSASFQQIATLPVGFRPSGSVIAAATNANTSAAIVSVSSTGALQVAAPGGVSVTFAFSFPVA